MSDTKFNVDKEAILVISEMSACSLERSHLHFKCFVRCCYSGGLGMSAGLHSANIITDKKQIHLKVITKLPDNASLVMSSLLNTKMPQAVALAFRLRRAGSDAVS